MRDESGPTEGIYEPAVLGWVQEPTRPSTAPRKRDTTDVSERVLAERRMHEKRRDDFLNSAKGGAVVSAALVIVFVIWPGFWTFVLASVTLGLVGYGLVEAWIEHRSADTWKSD